MYVVIYDSTAPQLENDTIDEFNFVKRFSFIIAKRSNLIWWEIANNNTDTILSAAFVKLEIPVLVQSRKSSILSPTSFQLNDTFWRMASAAIEQLRCKSQHGCPGTREIRAERLTPESLQIKKTHKNCAYSPQHNKENQPLIGNEP